MVGNQEKNPLAALRRGGSMLESARTAMVPTAGPAPKTLVPNADELRIGPFVVSPVGLRADDVVDEKAWYGFMSRIKPVVVGIQWILGDWLNVGESAWGKSYEEMAGLTGYEEKSLREYAYVARNVSLSIRMDKLTFGHHQIVASYEPADQAAWLQYAVEERLSIAELRKALKKKPRLKTVDPVGVLQRRLLGLREKFQPLDDGQRMQMAALYRKMADDIERGE